MRLLGTITLILLCKAYGHRVHNRDCEGHIRHVHLAVGRDPTTEMTISFASIPSQFIPPVGGVLIGTEIGKLDTLYLESDTTSYSLPVPKRDLATFEDRYYSPTYHHVPIYDLEPDTIYYYQPILKATEKGFQNNNYNIRKPAQPVIGDSGVVDPDSEEAEERRYRKLIKWGPYNSSKADCPATDKVRYFKTAPKDAVSGLFAIMGDIGQFPHSEELLNRLLRDQDKINAAFLAGDLSYAEQNHKRWDTFMDFLDDYPLVDRVPLQIVAGNHDIDKTKETGDIFLAYENRFRMPRVKSPELGVYNGEHEVLPMHDVPYPLPYEWGNSFYSFKYSGTHFIMINSYASMEPGSTQHGWIKQELQRVNRKETPWLTVVMHCPYYNTFQTHRKDIQVLAEKEHLEPLFVQYKVNFVFTGHVHAYQRTSPVAFEKLNPSGAVHITVGAGGRECKAPFHDEEPEPWLEARDATLYGYGLLRIHNQTTAEWTWVHTGRDEDRDFNELAGSEKRLPGSPGIDHVYIANQYYA